MKGSQAPKKVCMLLDISKIAVTDDHVSSLLCKARESAEIYLLIARRQRGCDGMGELAMIKEEFREAVNDLIGYCKDKGCHVDNFEYDLDAFASILIAKK
jgi:hypothetical protein